MREVRVEVVSLVRHHAICVSSWQQSAIAEAHQLARSLSGLTVTALVLSGETWSFLIGPEGSKSGWAAAGRAEADRETWKRQARERFCDAAGQWVNWVHVAYPGPGDEHPPVIVDSERAAAKEGPCSTA